MRFVKLVVLLAVANLTLAEQIPCWLDPGTEPDVSNFAALKTLLLPIRLDKPEDDAKVRIAHGDYRILAIYGFSAEYPGIEDKSVICKVGVRYLDGTTDGLESREHAQLLERVKAYARRYNSALVRLLDEKG